MSSVSVTGMQHVGTRVALNRWWGRSVRLLPRLGLHAKIGCVSSEIEANQARRRRLGERALNLLAICTLTNLPHIFTDYQAVWLSVLNAVAFAAFLVYSVLWLVEATRGERRARRGLDTERVDS